MQPVEPHHCRIETEAPYLSSPTLRLGWTEEPGLTLCVAGELDVATAPALREALLDALGRDPIPDLVVDTREVTFVDSSGLAVLLMAARRWTAEERRLVLRPGAPVSRVVDLLGVRRAFEVEDRA